MPYSNKTLITPSNDIPPILDPFLSYKTEYNYSQPKLELYGLYWALKEAALWIISVKNLIVEVDANSNQGNDQ